MGGIFFGNLLKTAIFTTPGCTSYDIDRFVEKNMEGLNNVCYVSFYGDDFYNLTPESLLNLFRKCNINRISFSDCVVYNFEPIISYVSETLKILNFGLYDTTQQKDPTHAICSILENCKNLTIFYFRSSVKDANYKKILSSCK